MPELIVVQRLILITVLAGFIGYERERHGREAGFRTHILVGIGACLVMLTALHLMEALAGRVEVDPTRMAAQVVSGIGFLGAGTIIRFRASIRGLTTAAGLWAVAGIGLAVGAGFLFGAVTATVIVIIALYGLGRWERHIRKAWYKVLIVETPGKSDPLVQIRRVLSAYDVEIRDVDLTRQEGSDATLIELNLKLISQRDEDTILQEVLKLEGTRRAHWA